MRPPWTRAERGLGGTKERLKMRLGGPGGIFKADDFRSRANGSFGDRGDILQRFGFRCDPREKEDIQMAKPLSPERISGGPSIRYRRDPAAGWLDPKKGILRPTGAMGIPGYFLLLATRAEIRAVAKIAPKTPAIIVLLSNTTASFSADHSKLDERLAFFKGIIQYRDPSDAELSDVEAP